jgi:hypothetical protein
MLQNVLLSVTAEPAMLSIVILGVDILGAVSPYPDTEQEKLVCQFRSCYGLVHSLISNFKN